MSSTSQPQESVEPTEGIHPAVTVGVVAICGAAHLERCLEALALQEVAPPFETVVVHDPLLPGMAAVRARFPHVSLISNEGQRTPLELAARVVAHAKGELVLLTEDHCLPDSRWVGALCSELREGRAAVGGVVDRGGSAGATDWAFYFVDFFRYAPPVSAGVSRSLTVCNVAYRRSHLNAISGLWREIFHETAVNEALRDRFGDLWLTPAAVTRTSRSVRLGDALRERYSFGRLFGCTRNGFITAKRRVLYAILAPFLPLLLMARMGHKALSSRASLRAFGRSFPALCCMVIVWSWGEWLGYLTGRGPASLEVAADIQRRAAGVS